MLLSSVEAPDRFAMNELVFGAVACLRRDLSILIFATLTIDVLNMFGDVLVELI